MLLPSLIALALTAVECDTVVVCPPAFRQALAPWLEHRAQEGHTFAFISNAKSSGEIRTSIRRAAAGGKLRFVVLVGDASPWGNDNPTIRRRSVPVRLVDAKVTRQWGGPPQIATDNWYADLNDDQVPDLAVGRLTADSVAELKTIVEKILAYEQCTDFGTWRRNVNFVAALGGLGPAVDWAVETAAKKLITDGIPTEFATRMTYASSRSPYCPDPRRFQEAAVEPLNDGCLFWVYMGHAQIRTLDRIRVPGANYPILDYRDAQRLSCRTGGAIAFFLACYTGAFDAAEDCLAEEMLRAPGAPVAVVCGSRLTMPYAMAVLGTELLDEYFVRNNQTLGEALLAAKRNMLLNERPSAHRLMLDALASVASGARADLAAERLEHVQLFNLLGDPLLRIRRPRKLEVHAPVVVEPGAQVRVTGQSPVDGICTVELICPRGRLPFEPPSRDRYEPTAETLAGYTTLHRRANDPRWCRGQTRVERGRFAIKLAVPPEATGPAHVRVFVQGTDDFAAGSADLRIQVPVLGSR